MLCNECLLRETRQINQGETWVVSFCNSCGVWGRGGDECLYLNPCSMLLYNSVARHASDISDGFAFRRHMTAFPDSDRILYVSHSKSGSHDSGKASAILFSQVNWARTAFRHSLLWISPTLCDRHAYGLRRSASSHSAALSLRHTCAIGRKSWRLCFCCSRGKDGEANAGKAKMANATKTVEIALAVDIEGRLVGNARFFFRQ